jgi:alkylation response protein AidB-like acyl-CoA dehydrogenase
LLTLEERQAIEATLRRFTEKVDRTLFAGEEPDGDLSRVLNLLDEAREIGILADPGFEEPSYEMGVWGQLCREEGLALSLSALSILGEACAGFAAMVHAQGLGCLALDGVDHLPGRTLVSVVFTPSYGVPLSSRLQEEGSGLKLREVGEGYELSGASHFCLAAREPDYLVCFALLGESEPEWVSLTVDPGAEGVGMVEVGHRVGLRAPYLFHLRCEKVFVRPVQVVRTGGEAWRSVAQVAACDWLGQAAIALGVARRSLRDSRSYAAERYQGGRMIEEHASVQMLQGIAEYDVILLAAILERHAEVPLADLPSRNLLRWAVGAKLALGEHAQRAVTSCLQTLGGYGYMEDYGFEKRLRDVSALRGLHGAADQLRLFLNELAQEE